MMLGKKGKWIQEKLVVLFCTVLISGSTFGAYSSITAREVYAMTPVKYGITVGSLILSLLTGSGTATVPTGTVGNGSNIADVAIQMDTEAFSIGNLVDQGVCTFNDSSGLIETWNAESFNNLLLHEGLSKAYSSAKVDEVLSTAFTEAGTDITPFSGGVALSVLLNHIGDTNKQIASLDYYVQDPEGWQQWHDSLPENQPGLEGFVNRLKQAVMFDAFKDAFFSIFGKNIDNGIRLDINIESDIGYEYSHVASVLYKHFGEPSSRILYYEDGLVCAFWQSSIYSFGVRVINITDSDKRFYYHNSSGYVSSSVPSHIIVNFFKSNTNNNRDIIVYNSVGNFFNSIEEADTYLSQFISDNPPAISPFYSPDVLNQNGNLQGTENQPTALQPGQQIAPIPKDQYENWANQVRENTENQDYAPNQEITNNFITQYITNADEPSTPTNPTNPISDSDQSVPGYEAPADFGDEELGAELAPYEPELTEIFPFCIPFDLIALLEAFDADPVAPKIELPLDLEFNNPFTGASIINVHEKYSFDFNDMADTVKGIRIFEVISFMIGLMMITRNIMIRG